MGGSLDSLSAAMGVSSGASRSRRMGDVAEVRLRQYERRQVRWAGCATALRSLPP